MASKTTIHVIGAGSFGTALAKVCSKKNEVSLYTIESDVLESITKKKENTKYLKGVSLKGITAYTDISKIVEAQIILIAVPSFVVEKVCQEIKPFYKNQIIISACKGLSSSCDILTNQIEKILGCSTKRVLALSGPSFAHELANGVQTYVTLAGSTGIARQVKEYIQTPTFHLHLTTDKLGVQLLGFYKNIIALLIGICDGVKLQENFRAALLTKAYYEFYRLNSRHFHRHTFIGYAGIGDLFLTVNSKESRNKQCGILLSQGHSITSCKKKIGQTIEGYENIVLLKKAKQTNHYFDSKLITALYAICHNPKKRYMIKTLENYLLEVKTS